MNRPQNCQEWLDELIKRSLENRFPSVSADGTSCRYRGEGGRECAIGLVISDENYSPEIEGVPVEGGGSVRASLPGWIVGFRQRDLTQVQQAHDKQAIAMHWRRVDWNHRKFVEDLKECSLFQGCQFPKEAAA